LLGDDLLFFQLLLTVFSFHFCGVSSFDGKNPKCLLLFHSRLSTTVQVQLRSFLGLSFQISLSLLVHNNQRGDSNNQHPVKLISAPVLLKQTLVWMDNW
jgi:hypothetical protein